MHLIDLKNLTNNEVVMLSGEPRGVAAREKFLKECLPHDEHLKIIAPEDLITITPSFVQGFFSARMDAVGIEAFEAHLDLSGLPDHLKEDLKDGLNKLKYRRKQVRGEV
ncbi:hypothetical protein [Sulfitobacter pontiacus]|uniref:hypothetical protein n=1 Tax=Sulfitobacter pontiacus TaxID=60137 RepID=UPI0010483598|nr:hypothetical protein [Sulfitobacter pontiacus]